MKQARLTLEDGTIFTGKSFGSEKSTSGEVVFYTAMTGYPESLTDPSYSGQLLVSTYPMIGNYGVPGWKTEGGLSRFFESHKLHISGLIIADYSFEFSHWNAEKSLSDWLREYQIPGIFDIDTRALTKILREKGSMLGKIEFEEELKTFYDPNKENLVAKVSCTKREVYGEGSLRVVLIDCGVKNNIIRCLLKRDATVIRVPWNYDFTREEYDGVFISNGPGDPSSCGETIEIIQKILQDNKPIMGICLGNQLLARAAGGETFKLKYGHRSHNQPVLLNGTDRCFITSQNHGYAVVTESLPQDWEPLFTNANDHTNEGIKHKFKPFFSTQFHPEAASGPTDTEFLFDEFIQNIKKAKQ
ncbi:MAG: glutamine-hydrolyzing carbamoyl-phosphate synthase small subunit [Mariniphaga sp.]|nr:glutamine-hydrolyzing carbamoyl-phosphate synthase small subunit [Mariniphaga sp.]MDD4226827.1 glutamine-hydrolyzing carbamoyl-phosphate synthase small subunit [Mariniphaga sp.]